VLWCLLFASFAVEIDIRQVHLHSAMDIPTKRPANADETQRLSEKAITGTACGLVAIVVILRYLGRWTLKRRIDLGKGKMEKVYGLDDREFSDPFTNSIRLTSMLCSMCLLLQRSWA
jgi:hypothetical protein